jgi:hypothetical protein
MKRRIQRRLAKQRADGPTLSIRLMPDVPEIVIGGPRIEYSLDGGRTFSVPVNMRDFEQATGCTLSYPEIRERTLSEVDRAMARALSPLVAKPRTDTGVLR